MKLFIVILIYFKFFPQQVIENRVKRKINPEVLLIRFKTNIKDTTILNLLRKNKLEWTEDESSFYGKAIVNKINTIIDPFGPTPLTHEQIKLRKHLQKN